MQRNEAIQLIQQTFEAAYDEGRFRRFVKEILHTVEERDDTYAGTYIPEAYKDCIKSYKYLFKYTTPDQYKTDIAVFAVNVANKHKLEKARSELRNFIAWVMKKRDNKEVVLVAFYTDEDKRADWRFSFIRRETTFDFDTRKTETAISPAKRYSYLVGETETSHTAKEQFVDLVAKERNNPTLTELENAFAVEKVSKEFFQKYEELYLRLCDSMDAILKKDEKIRTNFELNQISIELFCKKLMGQIVFLYFIQKKGWLGVEKEQPWGSGDRRFLRTLFEQAKTKGHCYFNDCLEPLFYDALATERDSHWYPRLKCKIPFLNGGLFDPVNNYDWVHTDINLPNKLFSNENKDGILDVFDIYNFTVKEDEPLEKEVAIDPEMLGKVFENLLEIRDRKSKGAFYTPREIVHYMCQESLIHYLYSKLNKTVVLDDLSFFIRYGDTFSEIEDKVGTVKSYGAVLPDSIKTYAKAIDDALADVKICDPAVGSGAFPVGLMHEIIRARLTLLNSGFIKEAKRRTVYEYKRQVIQNSLYGVDIEESAIEVAKLRLWLSLIVDEDDINNIKPLPNLDYKMVRGNSLQKIDDRDMFNYSALQEIEILKTKFFDTASRSEKKSLSKQIDGILNILTEGGKVFDFKIYFSEIFKTDKTERNFELSNTMFDGQQLELPAHTTEYGKGGGFDIVIGNPPYIQLQKFRLSDEDKKKGKQDMQALYKAQKFETYAATGDIYCLFYEKGITLLKDNGYLCFITSNKWMRAGYGENLREYLSRYNPEILIDLGGNVFESATVDTNILLVKKTKNEGKTLSCTIKDHTKKMSDLIRQDGQAMRFDKNSWVILNPVEQNIKVKIEAKGTPLKDSDISIYRGIITGFNEAFIITDEKRQELIAHDPKSAEIIRPILRGKDIKRYGYEFNNLYVILAAYGSHKWLPEKYPAIYEHLKSYEERLRERGQCRYTTSGKPNPNKEYPGQHHWLELDNNPSREYLDDFSRPKIIYREISEEMDAAYIEEEIYINNKCYFITGKIDMYFLQAFLNSKLFNRMILQGANATGGKGAEFMQKILVPKVSATEQKAISDLAKKINSVKDRREIPDLENEIDALFYRFYGLTAEEQNHIETPAE